MHAIEVAETGGPEVMRNVEQPTPSPGPDEVSIKAEAIGVNFVDTYFRSGLYRHELPLILGLEVAGTVAVVGECRDRRCRRRLCRILRRTSRRRCGGAGWAALRRRCGG